jgi:hypothetical protein
MVTTAEALGTGVYQDDSRGKVFMYEDMTTRVTVVVNLVDEQIPNKQFCYACMWGHLKRMIELMGPPDDNADHTDGETANPDVSEVSASPFMQEASPILGPFSPLRDTFRPHPFPYEDRYGS